MDQRVRRGSDRVRRLAKGRRAGCRIPWLEGVGGRRAARAVWRVGRVWVGWEFGWARRTGGRWRAGDLRGGDKYIYGRRLQGVDGYDRG